jgi:hypothetical protein
VQLSRVAGRRHRVLHVAPSFFAPGGIIGGAEPRPDRHARVLERFTWPRVVDRCLEVYRGG